MISNKIKRKIEQTFFKYKLRYTDAKGLTGLFLSMYTEIVATVILFNQKGWNIFLLIPLIIFFIVFHIILGSWMHNSGFKNRWISYNNQFNPEIMEIYEKTKSDKRLIDEACFQAIKKGE